MAGAGEMVASGNVMDFTRTAGGRKIMMMFGVAAVVAVMGAVWMWGQQPDYRVLFSNFSDRDGGAIVAELEKMNIPYKFAEGGGAVLVPASHVYDARLKLASQGLPKGGNVGFELMENQKLGSSQFIERVNFQRAMEGELARSIESVSSVQAARVHLAMPKDSVFVSEQKAPTASVLLNLHPGRTLDTQQVSAIVHLVASSVPELPIKNVTIVDQNGNLLSDTGKTASINGMDPSQIKYVQDLQQSITKRIESIITPIVGPNNVRAEATADVDFSRSEQAVESYKPNQTPDAMVVRSQQTSESINGGANAGGVPGALTNQPPAPATAPITAAGKPQARGQAGSPTANMRKDATVNYEIDKTIQYVQQGSRRPEAPVRCRGRQLQENHRQGRQGFDETLERSRNHPDHQSGQGSHGLQPGAWRHPQRGEQPLCNHGTGSHTRTAAMERTRKYPDGQGHRQIHPDGHRTPAAVSAHAQALAEENIRSTFASAAQPQP